MVSGDGGLPKVCSQLSVIIACCANVGRIGRTGLRTKSDAKDWRLMEVDIIVINGRGRDASLKNIAL